MMERLIIKDFRQFGGRHCETAALKNVLDYHGLSLPEEMLLGLGGGIGFVYWYMKLMPCPFIGTRNEKAGELLSNAAKQIGASIEIFQTNSPRKGYEKLKALLPSKHGLVKIEYPSEIKNLKQGIKEGIRDCCEVMLRPPIKNFGLAGIQKWANLVVKWPQQFEGMNLLGALMNSFIFGNYSATS
jgi:hypothetical protein